MTTGRFQALFILSVNLVRYTIKLKTAFGHSCRYMYMYMYIHVHDMYDVCTGGTGFEFEFLSFEF